MDVEQFVDPRDPHSASLIGPPRPCPHGHGKACDCQLPYYSGLYVLPLPTGLTKDGKVRHVIARARITHDGGMREFMDPIEGHVVGSCGLYFWYDHVLTVEQFLERSQS